MAERPTRARPRRTVVRHTNVRVSVTRGPDRGASVEAAGAPVRIGTAEDNDLVLSDDTVSRHHCELEVTPDGLHIRDAGSTNGILAGKIRVHDAILPIDALLVLGGTQIVVTPLAQTVEREQVAADRFGDVIGKSPRARELFAVLDRIVDSDVTVLIEGETGTGKDLVAESLHRLGPRASEPFVVFDSGAVSAALVESELFGHERGAFTGAVEARAGVFEQANGGTVFLDEIGELPRDLQPKLLRVLEKREVRRVGGSKVHAVDVRILAATNRNLRSEVKRGAFREDLYFRLAGATVTVPPLRDRMEDLPLLVEHFLALDNAALTAKDIPAQVWALFASYRWPGNARELRNAVRRLLVSPDRPLGTAGDAASGGRTIAPLRAGRREAMDAFEREYVAQVLAATGGNVTRAAVLADVSRQMMQKLMRKHGRGE